VDALEGDKMEVDLDDGGSSKLQKLKEESSVLHKKITELQSQASGHLASVLAKEDQVETLQAQVKASETQLNDTKSKLEQALLNVSEELRDAKEQMKQNAQDRRKLHAMILQGSQKGDPFDDDYICGKFTTLQGDIQHVVKAHFQRPGAKSFIARLQPWSEFEDIKEPDDRDYFVQAEIADSVYALFKGETRLFGLLEAEETYLGDFEDLIRDHGKHM
jgi:small-conductance mechanosensitive channel